MPTFFAVRGSRELTEDEFRTHLALASRLENVGVLLGAGASVCAGGKVMAGVWKDFKTVAPASITWLIDQKFIKDSDLADNATVNVENLLDLLDIADLEWRRAGDTTKADTLAIHRAQVRRAVVRAAILDKAFWENPETTFDSPKLLSHVRMLSRLASNRQPGQAAPWVYTVNYDLAIEWAAEALGLQLVNGFSGLHGRTFSPSCFDLGFRNVHARGEARFGTYNIYLGKIHGSLSWRLNADTALELSANAQWPAIKTFLDGQGAETWPGLLIFPGAAKFVQTTGFIYGEIIRRLTEFLSRSNTCLIVNGYAFNDEHLNRVLLSALQNPTLQLIIYLPELVKLQLFPTLPQPEANERLTPNLSLQRLIQRQLPQVTICGYDERAHFDAMAADLPEPALLDDTALRAREIERLLRGSTGQPVPTATAAAAAPPPQEPANESGAQ